MKFTKKCLTAFAKVFQARIRVLAIGTRSHAVGNGTVLVATRECPRDLCIERPCASVVTSVYV